MPELTCAHCGTELDSNDPHGTVETEFLDPDADRLEPNAYFLCPGCYADLEEFLTG